MEHNLYIYDAQIICEGNNGKKCVKTVMTQGNGTERMLHEVRRGLL